MAWTPPRTWSPGETVTASLMNAQIRDNENVLKVSIDDDGALRTLLKGFAFSSGQGNGTSAGVDTQLTSYDVTVPAAFLAQPGDALIVEGTFVVGATAGTAIAKLQVASGSLVTLFSTTAVNTIVPFRMLLRRRTSTTGSLTGISWINAAAAGAPANYLVNSGVTSVDWTISQALKIFAQHSTTTGGVLKLTDYLVDQSRGVSGVTV